MNHITGLAVLYRPRRHYESPEAGGMLHLTHPTQRDAYACGRDNRPARPATDGDAGTRWCQSCLDTARLREMQGVS